MARKKDTTKSLETRTFSASELCGGYGNPRLRQAAIVSGKSAVADYRIRITRGTRPDRSSDEDQKEPD